MPAPAIDRPISPLRQRLIDDMNMRRFSRETQRNYIRDVGRFATFLRRSPDTATADDIRRFQIEQRDLGVPTPTRPELTKRPSGTHKRTDHEHHAALGRASGAILSGRIPSWFS